MPTNVYDVTQPPDTQLANLLGQDLRNLALNVQQRMALISGPAAGIWNPALDAQPTNWTGLLYFATDTGVISQWSGSAWVPVNVQSNIVARARLTGQVAAIGLTTLYSVSVALAGSYRFVSNLLITTGGTSGNIAPSMSYNNGVIGQTINFGNFSVVAGDEQVLSNTVNFHSSGGQAISYSVAFNSVVGAPVYSLNLTLEYLG